MRQPTAGTGCAVTVAAALIVAGGLLIWAGRVSAPHDTAEASAFRADRSCGAAVVAAEPRGACTSKPVEVLSAYTRVQGFSRTRTGTPHVALRFADGTFDDEELDGSGGGVFVLAVHAGARGRAQFYRGRLVRVVADGTTAETAAAPDAEASTDTEMLWAGSVMLAIAALVLVLTVRSLTRARAA